MFRQLQSPVGKSGQRVAMRAEKNGMRQTPPSVRGHGKAQVHGIARLQSPVGKSGQREIVRCNESGEERNAPNTSVRTEARKSTGAS